MGKQNLQIKIYSHVWFDISLNHIYVNTLTYLLIKVTIFYMDDIK